MLLPLLRCLQLKFLSLVIHLADDVSPVLGELGLEFSLVEELLLELLLLIGSSLALVLPLSYLLQVVLQLLRLLMRLRLYLVLAPLQESELWIQLRERLVDLLWLYVLFLIKDVADAKAQHSLLVAGITDIRLGTLQP